MKAANDIPSDLSRNENEAFQFEMKVDIDRNKGEDVSYKYQVANHYLPSLVQQNIAR